MLPIMQKWLGCGFHPLYVLGCGSRLTQVHRVNMPLWCCILMSRQVHQVPPIMQKWPELGLLHMLQGRSYYTKVNRVNIPLYTHILVSPQLLQAPHFLRKGLGCVAQPQRTSQCRSFSAMAFRDAASQAENSCSMRNLKEVIDEALTLGTDASRIGATPVDRISELRRESDEKSIVNANKGVEQTIVVQESVEALEELLKKLETSVSNGDPRIGALCLRLAQLCVSKDEKPEKILVYGQRALEILGRSEISLECATTLEVIGCAYYKKGEFEKAIIHLERAAVILEKLKHTVKQEDMGSLQYAVQALLGQANMSLGRPEEALVNFQDALAINERMLGSHDPNLGKSYQQVAEAFMQVQDLEEARALCLKALAIYIECHGSRSLQVAELRKLLSVIYYDLDDFEKVLSEHQLVRPIFEALGKSEEVASLDLASGEAFLCLDRYTEAISKLKDVITQTTHANHCHGQALVLLAKAYTALKESMNAAIYCNKALDVLRNKEPSVMVGASLVELGLVLRQLCEIEQALTVFKIALGIYQRFPKEQAAVAFIEGQIGLLYLSSERAIDALPYLERCVAKNESILGLQSEELVDVYNHMGVAYVQLGKLDDALAKFEAAKAIAEQNDLSEDPATMTLYNNLVHVYTALGRYMRALSRIMARFLASSIVHTMALVGDALLCQQLLVKTLKKTGLVTDVILEDAKKKLQDLLQEAAKCPP